MDAKESARTSMKKLYKQFYKIMPFILVPGLIMSAVLPFFLPMLKMMTLAAGMLNNMALTGAVFTLLRNNAFNDKYQNKVIYINEGYSNDGYHDKYEPLGDTPSQVIVDPNFGNNFGGFEDHKIKNFFVGNKPINDYEVNADWLKELTEKVASPTQVSDHVFDRNTWYKQNNAEK